MTGNRTAEGTALDWSMTAMRDVTGRLGRARASDRARAFAVISEAVWWVTIVDGTLMRYHPDACDAVLACESQAGRQLIEGTFAGLRFVRNQMGHDLDHRDFICWRASQGDTADGPATAAGAATAGGAVTAWRWASVREPALDDLPPGGQEWEKSRYLAYQTRLAGQAVGETFERAVAFLDLAAARTPSEPPSMV
jgi:hypothetical protein